MDNNINVIMEKIVRPLIVVSFVVFLAVCGIMYWNLEKANNESRRQNNGMQQQNNELQQQIDGLQTQLNQVVTEKNELQQKIDDLNKKPEQYIRVISPNGGESVCLNDDLIIKWESKGVEAVGVRLIKQAFGGGGYYYMGLNAIPSAYNEENISGKGDTTWKVTGIPLSDTYKLEVINAEDSKIMDESDSFFSVRNCEG
jgi:TolA-binding protein